MGKENKSRNSMELLHQPYGPWHLIASLAALIALLVFLGRGGLDRWQRLGRKKIARSAIIICSVIALLLLAWAAWNPRMVKRGGSERLHLELLIDVSDSMRRDAPAWDRQQKTARDWVKAQVLASPKSLRKRATAGVTTFGSRAVSAGKARPLADWPKSLAGLRESEFATGADTDIAAGLRKAAERIAEQGGRGAVVLLSDGHNTVESESGEPAGAGSLGDTSRPIEAARELGAKGIPVLVLAAEGSPPALAMSAVDLAPTVDSEAPTRLRGGIANQLGDEVRASMTVAMNPGMRTAPGPHGISRTTSNTFDVADGAWARFRPELTFEGYGLQVVEVTLAEQSADPAKQRPPQRRRFYTQVKRPPRLLTIGDNRWLSALGTSDFDIIQKQAGDLTPDMNLADVDAIVLSGIDGNRFKPGVQQAFVDAVKNGGTGLFFINGKHEGDEKLPSILSTYYEAPVGDILPVVPRKSTYEPPERNVVLMLDTSGSMGGWEKVMKNISRSIVDRLRPGDTLDVIAFTVSANHIVKELKMTDANKKKAIAQIDRLGIGGGTSPKAALDLIETRKFVEGGLIFISDGGFSRNDIDTSIRRRPDLRVTVFSCGGNHYGTLDKLADPEPFSTLPMPDLRRDDQLPIPDLPVSGSAFSRMRGEGVMIGVRPKLAMPVLATRPVGAGRTGSWTSGLDGEWIKDIGPAGTEGQEAVTAWMRRMVGFSERDRYDFDVEEAGRVLNVRVSLLPKEGRVPRVDRLNARIMYEDGSAEGVKLTPDGFVAGQFTGDIPRPERGGTQRAFLTISEEGADALNGRQRVPIVLLPPREAAASAASREDWTHGTNEGMLLALAQASGGAWQPKPGSHVTHSQRAITSNRALWPWLALLGGLFLLGAVGVRRLSP